ncbi:MAG: helix-turn-helix domain-containing protein [Methanoregula sp.]|jgi:DNA-binding HxlR family transcriptional regulator
MDLESDHICLCCLRGIMPVISKKWAVCIILSLGRNGKMRFNEIMGNCETISPKTLSDVLKDLSKAGLILRESYHEIPPRVEYSLTDEGNELRVALVPLLNWAKKHNRMIQSYGKVADFQAPDP